MFKAPISVIHIDQTPRTGQSDGKAWARLQAALGDGMATVILKTPDRRGDWPARLKFKANKKAPPADAQAVRDAFDDLVGEWRYALETILNRRWGLCDNPYSKAWLMPGFILLHEDPLGWPIDNNSVEIAEGGPYDGEPTWALLKPMSQSNHEAMAVHNGVTLPHADILNKALTRAAKSEGHADICPLYWAPQPSEVDQLDVVEA
jgi:hypothetical protein